MFHVVRSIRRVEKGDEVDGEGVQGVEPLVVLFRSVDPRRTSGVGE